jgi:hypothetical protein
LKRVKEYKRRECEYYFSLIFLQQTKNKEKTNKKQRKNKQKTKKKQTKKVARAIG